MSIIAACALLIAPIGPDLAADRHVATQAAVTTTFPLSDYDLYLIASIVAGEASCRVMGENACRALAWTIRNRLVPPGVKPQVRTMELAQVVRYYAGRGAPTEHELDVVREVFKEPNENDPVNGAIFAVDGQSVRRLNLRRGDFVYAGAQGLELHVYASNPFR